MGIMDASVWNKDDDDLKPLAELIVSIMDVHCQWECTADAVEAARQSVSNKIRATRRAKPGPQNIISAYHCHVMKILNAQSNKLSYWLLLKKFLEDRVCIIPLTQL